MSVRVVGWMCMLGDHHRRVTGQRGWLAQGHRTAAVEGGRSRGVSGIYVRVRTFSLGISERLGSGCPRPTGDAIGGDRGSADGAVSPCSFGRMGVGSSLRERGVTCVNGGRTPTLWHRPQR